MLRTALKPRWLGLFALLVVILVSFFELGLWQLHVAQDKGLADALHQAHAARPVALEDVVRPHQPFPDSASGRMVTATGRYAADSQLLVGVRRLEGQQGYWVVAPLILERTGARLPVVRGFVSQPSQAGTPPSGRVSVAGSLAPGESPADPPGGAPSAIPVLGSIDLAVLVNRWPGELYNAFVFAQGEQSEPAGAAVAPGPGLRRVPPPEVTGGLRWRNAAYAVQWWLFAGFAAFMWFRMVRDDAARD